MTLKYGHEQGQHFRGQGEALRDLDRAARGERIVICRHNKPVAELRAIADTVSMPRTIGPIAGRPTFDLPAAFFEPLPDDELEQWEVLLAPDPLSARSAAPTSGRPSRVAESKEVSFPAAQAATASAARVRLLLDTCTFLWLAGGATSLPPAAVNSFATLRMRSASVRCRCGRLRRITERAGFRYPSRRIA